MPEPVARVLPSAAFVSLTEKVRFDELGAPPRIFTVTVWVVKPGANVSVPVVAK